MRSLSWIIWLGSQSGLKCFDKRKADKTDTTRRKPLWRWSREEHGDKPRNTCSQQKLEEAGMGPPPASRGRAHLHAPGFPTSKLQNWERIHLCCLKPPSLWEYQGYLVHQELDAMFYWSFLKVATPHLFTEHMFIEHILSVRNCSGFQGHHRDGSRYKVLPSRSLHSGVRRQTRHKWISSAQCSESAQTKRQCEFSIPSGTFASILHY